MCRRCVGRESNHLHKFWRRLGPGREREDDRPFGDRPRPERFKRDAVATPLPGPGLVGRGPCQWHDVASAGRPRPPRPGRRAAADPEPSAPPVEVATETVDLLEASKAGDLDVVARGHGQDQVQLTIRNRSTRRLNVIIPPGLVAASTVGQAARRRRRPRLQSMGLGSVANREGAFGEFQGNAAAGGLRSVAADRRAAHAVGRRARR